MDGPVPFVPLRTDPPPELATTLWIRSALTFLILLTAVELVAFDVVDPAGRWGGWAAVVVGACLHAGVVTLLVVWSGRVMANVEAIMPARRYGAAASSTTAGALWVVGFGAPAAAVLVAVRVRPGVADSDALVPTLAAIVAVFVALLAAWAPFGYHQVHAQRIGAPSPNIVAWFWAPLLTFVVGATALALTPVPDDVGVVGVYGLAAGVFAWSTWRAVTVFDEVIDLRWQRWRIDWEQTLEAMAAQPPPGPERGVVP